MLSFVFTEDSFRVDTPKEVLQGEEAALQESFLADKYQALFRAGFTGVNKNDSSTLSFLKKLSAEFIHAITKSPDLELAREYTVAELPEEVLERIERAVPFAIGTEYISRPWLLLQINRLNQVFHDQLLNYSGTVQMFLAEFSQELKVSERVFFHLVENKREERYPFAFLATYSTKDIDGGIVHKPLSYAMEEYKHDHTKLLDLLSCLDKVSDKSALLASFVESGEMFHPLKMTDKEAYEFLKAVPAIEECGVVCRVPLWWKQNQSAVQLQVNLGDKKASLLGFDTLIGMQPQLVVGGVELTQAEVRRLLKQTDGLALIKGKWIEVNHDRLTALLERMGDYEGELSLLEAMKLEGGIESGKAAIDVGVNISNGKWLGSLLANLRNPQLISKERVPKEVRAELRSYQETGFRWLSYMYRLGFGACLADDMGLGKTLQVITFLSAMYNKHKKACVLLIVPASLLGNWEKEIKKFAPVLPFRVLHGHKAETMENSYLTEPVFLNITTYGMAQRMKKIANKEIDCLILDEAQAIKNPGTKQTIAIKRISAKHKIAMTGTPIENDLTNLWSLFDFLNKGLLGSSAEFKQFLAKLPEQADGYPKLKNMIAPFVLRRLKSDKKIISDLPDKIEKTEYIQLSKKQIVLYRKQVHDLEKTLAEVEGVQRRGIVLAAITKLKQICNHPAHFLGLESYTSNESGKFELLKTLCTTIYEKRERLLLFTQYKEIIPHLAKFLEAVFNAKGMVIHGGVPVAKRQQMVDEFNGEAYIPFMILSLKAGGTGLNLTSANHVIHFDRWWNPAVENQATDRAYRIGQSRSVIVHKFVSVGTIEEKIDEMIKNKTDLADSIIGTGERWITEMSDEALIDLMKLEM